MLIHPTSVLCGGGVILISTIILFSCVVGDGDYCEFTLSVLMSQFLPYFDSSRANSRTFDQVYMVMIIIHILVLLHDFELSPTRPTL